MQCKRKGKPQAWSKRRGPLHWPQGQCGLGLSPHMLLHSHDTEITQEYPKTFQFVIEVIVTEEATPFLIQCGLLVYHCNHDNQKGETGWTKFAHLLKRESGTRSNLMGVSQMRHCLPTQVKCVFGKLPV